MSFLRLAAQEIARVHSVDPNQYYTQEEKNAVFLKKSPTMMSRFRKVVSQLPDDLSEIGVNHKYSVH